MTDDPKPEDLMDDFIASRADVPTEVPRVGDMPQQFLNLKDSENPKRLLKALKWAGTRIETLEIERDRAKAAAEFYQGLAKGAIEKLDETKKDEDS